MDNFWTESDVAPSTLDNFFDEESTISWTGRNVGQDETDIAGSLPTAESASSLASIVDSVELSNENASTDSSISRVGKSFGDRIDQIRHVKKWGKSSSSLICVECSSKDEEISDLKLRLERSYSKYNITLPPEDTVKRMVLGLPYSLESYKLHKDKIALLDCAAILNNSSAILMISIFLKRTLKKSLFDDILKERPIVARVYLNYLRKRHEHFKALELLLFLGKFEEAALLKYQIALSSNDIWEKIKCLRSTGSYCSEYSLSHEANMFNKQASLLELQSHIDKEDTKEIKNAMFTQYPRASSVTSQPCLTTLYYSCMYHWHDSDKKMASPKYIKKEFDIIDRQFLWTVLRARARVQHWPLPAELDKLLETPGLLRSLANMTSLTASLQSAKNILPMEIVVPTLQSGGAPKSVLTSFLELVSIPEVKLKLALEYECHQVVIAAYVALKDKQSLERYLTKLPQGSADFIQGENFLKNGKW